MPFSCCDDERLSWLENDFLQFLAAWKEAAPHKRAFISMETYGALQITTRSTVESTRFLLRSGFLYVLTAKFSSDPVEALFSTLRQLNGCNDQTNARAALSSLQKVLSMGIIHSSASGSTETVGPLGSCHVPLSSPTAATEMLPEQRTQLGEGTSPAVITTGDEAITESTDQARSSIAEIRILMRPQLAALQSSNGAPPPGIKTSALALIAGFLVKVTGDSVMCQQCVQMIKAPRSSGPATAVIFNMDRGGLSYHRQEFITLVCVLEEAAEVFAPLSINQRKPMSLFVTTVLPAAAQNVLSKHEGSTEEHVKSFTKLLCKFSRPFFTNYMANKTEEEARKKVIANKPTSRKVLKV